MNAARRRTAFLYLFLVMGMINYCHCDVIKDEKTVDPLDEIMKHVATFKAEARERGFDLDAAVDNLEISTQEQLIFDEKEFCGYVPLTQEGQYSTQVLFATNRSCWGDLSQWNHEVLVFHELGHAILDRDHREDKLPNGDWASIMQGNTGFGYTLYGENSPDKRKYYIDELFDKNTPAPDWAK